MVTSFYTQHVDYYDTWGKWASEYVGRIVSGEDIDTGTSVDEPNSIQPIIAVIYQLQLRTNYI
jgi:hypothetical protein